MTATLITAAAGPDREQGHAGRNGYLRILDRGQGQLKFLNTFPFSNNNVFKSIDS